MFKNKKKIDVSKGVVERDDQNTKDFMDDLLGGTSNKPDMNKQGMGEEKSNQADRLSMLDEINQQQYAKENEFPDNSKDQEDKAIEKKGGILNKLFGSKGKADPNNQAVPEQAKQGKENIEVKPKSKAKSIMSKIMMIVMALVLIVIGGSKLLGGGSRGGGEVLLVSKDQIKKDISKIVEKKEIQSLEVIESVDMLNAQEIGLNDEDTKKIEDKITGRVEHVKYGINANAKSLETSADFGIALLYVRIGDQWQLLNYEVQDFKEWVLKPEELVTVTQILKALQEIEFDGFTKGYIGNPDHTKVEIVDRKTDKDKGIDNLTVRVGIDNLIASYAIDGDLFFEFGESGWELKDENISVKPNWSKIKFSINSEPEIISREKVLSMVSEQSNLFTQIIDMKNVKKYSLYDATMKPMEVGIGVDYELNVEYEDLAIIKYIIRVPFEWTGATWVERDPKISVNSALFVNSLGTWFDKNTGDSMVLTDIIVPKDKKDDIEGLRGFIYRRGTDGRLTQESFTIDVDIALRADNYSGEIELSDGEKLPVLFDLVTKEIKIGESKFAKVHQALGFDDEVDIDTILDESLKRHIEEGNYPTINDIKEDEESKDGEDSKDKEDAKDDKADKKDDKADEKDDDKDKKDKKVEGKEDSKDEAVENKDDKSKEDSSDKDDKSKEDVEDKEDSKDE